MHKFIFFLGVIASAGLLSSEAGAVKKKTKGVSENIVLNYRKFSLTHKHIANVKYEGVTNGVGASSPTAKVKHQDFHFTRRIDKASPILMLKGTTSGPIQPTTTTTTTRAR